jgi:hypothetical protein
VTLTKPLFDVETTLGACLPDLLIDVYDRQRHVHCRLVIEAMDFETDAYAAAKTQTHPRLQCLGPVISIAPKDLPLLQADPQLLAQQIRAHL